MGMCRQASSRGLIHALLVAVLMPMAGCEVIARSQGKLPVVFSVGENAIGIEGNPNNKDLFVYRIDPSGKKTSEKVPLVRVAYYGPFSCPPKIVDDASRSKLAYYMIVDVANVVRDPTLGAEADEAGTRLFRKRLSAIAALLITAADWNGEVYWRHLTTFLQTYKAAKSASKVIIGAAVPAAFISPVAGASLAGSGLAVDTFVTDFTGDLNVEEYASLREAASTYREVKKGEMLTAIETAEPGSDAVSKVLRQAYDYAFTYSIKGAIHAAVQQNTELKNMIITGDSSWKDYFKQEIKGYYERLFADKKITQEDLDRISKWADGTTAPPKVVPAPE